MARQMAGAKIVISNEGYGERTFSDPDSDGAPFQYRHLGFLARRVLTAR
jgi:hypothetical protein